MRVFFLEKLSFAGVRMYYYFVLFFILRNRLTVGRTDVAKDDGVGVYENTRNRKRTDGGGGGATVGEEIWNAAPPHTTFRPDFDMGTGGGGNRRFRVLRIIYNIEKKNDLPVCRRFLRCRRFPVKWQNFCAVTIRPWTFGHYTSTTRTTKRLTGP